jgi:pSer/pThr/pTyr-binding forkhead associated (FHA) protein
MKFCRNCGTVLAAAPSPAIPPSPVLGGPGAGYGQAGGYGAPAPAPSYAPQAGYGAPPAGYGGPQPGQGAPAPAHGYAQPAPAPAPSAPEPAAGTTTCSRCGSPTPSGFAFCQQCGQKLGSPTGPGTPAIDAHGATLAVSGDQAVRAGLIAGGGPSPSPSPSPSSGHGAPRPSPAVASGLTTPSPASLVPAPQHAAPSAATWGTAVSVNRDGTDGDRYPLGGEFVIIGRAGAGIAFEQDRFLAREHARLEYIGGGVRVVPLDTFNGVFRKLDAPVELRDGDVVLLGREVLRFELVEADEKNPLPLVRHGVALFGSPPREPWARLLQIVPSGGVRDIRHLCDDEVVLGREEGDLVFSDDAFLSRRHATFTWDGQRALLSDLGSSNGTFFRLSGPHQLKHNEHLRMGDQLFRIELGR